MDLSSKDNNILTSIIKIEKRIRGLYKLIRNDEKNKSTYINTILSLIDREDALIEALEMNPQKLKIIEEMYTTRVGLSLDTSLLLGTSPHINEKSYPFYRLIARLRYFEGKKDENIKTMLDSYFLDNEVELLYLVISKEIDIFSYEWAQRRALVEYTHLILIDSPEVEKAILIRNMEPASYVDDCIDFHSDLLCGVLMRKLKKLSPDDLREYTELGNLIDSKKSLDFYRIPRFNKRYLELFNSLCRFASISTDDIRIFPDFLMWIAYLKTIIALLNRENREKVYTTFLKTDLVKNDKYPWMMDWIKENFKDIETDLVPHIRKISMHPNIQSL